MACSCDTAYEPVVDVKTWKFCENCGKELVTERQVISRYNPVTGKPTRYTSVRCPSYKYPTYTNHTSTGYEEEEK